MRRKLGNQESERQEVQARPSSIVKRRQEPLRARYQTAAHDARILDSARSLDSCAKDPFHGVVMIGGEQSGPWKFGIHRAVGGYHDLPNPGDLLCAALASCLDATVRMIADRLDIRLDHLEVSVEASADARGAATRSQRAGRFSSNGLQGELASDERRSRENREAHKGSRTELHRSPNSAWGHLPSTLHLSKGVKL